MFEIAVQLVLFAVVLAIVAVILQAALAPRFEFLVMIHGDSLKVTKGKVTADFLDNIREVCGELHITSGWVGGVKRGKNIALKFSRHFPTAGQQRLRNLWFAG